MSDGLKNVRHRREDALSRLDTAGVGSLLAEYYRRQGYRVDAIETQLSDSAEAGDADAGIDLRLQRDDTRLLVRCVHWNDKQVPHQRVRTWQDILAYQEVDGSIFATSGEFTASAIRTASLSKTLRLVDGGELRKMLMPLLDGGAGDVEDATAVEASAFADHDAALLPLPIAASATAADIDAEAERESEDVAVSNAAKATVRNAEPESSGARVQRGPAATATAASTSKFSKRSVWERGSRPATNTSIMVASVLLTLIVLTIVFRHRLDPYLGDPPRPVVKKPRNESPLAGTDYKTDVFAPAIRARDEPVGDKPKPLRPEIKRVDSPQTTPDEAIKVIERSTPEIWTEEQRRKSAAANK